MIAFSCPQCGLKLQVQEEFAGRPTSCPTCQQPLTVPSRERTDAVLPKDRIEGPRSALAASGIDAEVTLGREPAPSNSRTQASVSTVLARRGGSGERYLVAEEIARGGMGAVLRAVDCDIRREVAVKYLLDQADPRSKARFVEEAQITGQLEHPNIVPIHELGVDAHKRLFFSMKIVKGHSLAQILDDLRLKPLEAEKASPLSRLLNVFVNVCHALAYAHARGVIHRDLKPANIMIGDFGEVYVMDWGVAKVLGTGARGDPSALAPPAVAIDRAAADLTQEGAIMGTPVYMPPEQATGQVAALEPRSDIYSLGAILYEMLTLQPPIDKEGGVLTILMRVAEGQIPTPEVRAPQRARAGKIPKELAAVAMKALAKNKEDRYPSVEALRRDIERFQEGRSVSARDDTFREALWKLVKRNRGASITAGIGTLILTVVVATGFLAINNARLRAEVARQNADEARQQAEADRRDAEEARRRAEENYQSFVMERRAKQQQAQQAVPAYLRAARSAVNERKFDDALVQVDTALEYQPNQADARLLKGQLLIAQQKFADAARELDQYLKLRPADERTKKLADRCRRTRTRDAPALLELGELIRQQKVVPVAEEMFRAAERYIHSRQELQEVYQKRLEAAWPNLYRRWLSQPDGSFHLVLDGNPQITDLQPLRGMELSRLDLMNCVGLRDLSELHGMKLTALNLHYCRQVHDLTPLEGLPLTWLDVGGCPLPDLTALKGMKLTSLNLLGCSGLRDLAPLKGMPLAELVLSDCRHLRDLTPLAEMNLKVIRLPPEVDKGMDALRGRKSLTRINDLPAAEFWRRYDRGEFRQFQK
jgi:serine/threonine protein kinase